MTPTSAVLSDNYTSFTPGVSETNGLGSRFYLPDVQGNSRGLLNSSQAATDGYNWDAFGTLISRNGSNPTAYAWGAGSGYQTDNDTGLKLLGHRYYDTRIGRFISQDPAGDGDNWYAYCGNDPVDGTDPTGLSDGLPGSLGAPDSHYGMFEGGPDDMSIGASSDDWITSGLYLTTRQRTRTGTATAQGTIWGPWGDWQVIDSTPLGGGEMFATGYNPMSQMRRAPNWLQSVIQGIAAAAALHTGHVNPTQPVEVPQVVAEEAKSGKTEEKEGKKEGGKNFSRQLENFLTNSGRNAEDNLDYLVDVLNRQNSHSSSVLFGGASAAGELAW